MGKKSAKTPKPPQGESDIGSMPQMSLSPPAMLIDKADPPRAPSTPTSPDEKRMNQLLMEKIKELQAQMKEMQSTSDEKFERLEKAVGKLSKELTKAKEELEEKDHQLEDRERIIAIEQDKVANRDATITDLKLEVTEKTHQIRELNQAIQQKDEDLGAAHDSIIKSENGLETEKIKHRTTKNSLANAKEELNIVKVERDTANRDAAGIADQLAEAKNKIKVYSEQIEKLTPFETSYLEINDKYENVILDKEGLAEELQKLKNDLKEKPVPIDPYHTFQPPTSTGRKPSLSAELEVSDNESGENSRFMDNAESSSAPNPDYDRYIKEVMDMDIEVERRANEVIAERQAELDDEIEKRVAVLTREKESIMEKEIEKRANELAEAMKASIGDELAKQARQVADANKPSKERDIERRVKELVAKKETELNEASEKKLAKKAATLKRTIEQYGDKVLSEMRTAQDQANEKKLAEKEMNLKEEIEKRLNEENAKKLAEQEAILEQEFERRAKELAAKDTKLTKDNAKKLAAKEAGLKKEIEKQEALLAQKKAKNDAEEKRYKKLTKERIAKLDKDIEQSLKAQNEANKKGAKNIQKPLNRGTQPPCDGEIRYVTRIVERPFRNPFWAWFSVEWNALKLIYLAFVRLFLAIVLWFSSNRVWSGQLGCPGTGGQGPVDTDDEISKAEQWSDPEIEDRSEAKDKGLKKAGDNDSAAGASNREDAETVKDGDEEDISRKPLPTSSPDDLEIAIAPSSNPGTNPEICAAIPEDEYDPSLWNLPALILHIAAYLIVFSCLYERSLWLAANQITRSWYVDLFVPAQGRGWMQYPFHSSPYRPEPWLSRVDVWIWHYILEPLFQKIGVYTKGYPLPG
ncbi:hypothetical protein B0O99DRAFT_595764 [Bisporella sp. PMI_857]|nr:hypothetical protein B0O99DRAFT_595764 [Bisporella sp. PMI_857]